MFWWGSAAGLSTAGEMEIYPGSWTPLPINKSFYPDSPEFPEVTGNICRYTASCCSRQPVNYTDLSRYEWNFNEGKSKKWNISWKFMKRDNYGALPHKQEIILCLQGPHHTFPRNKIWLDPRAAALLPPVQITLWLPCVSPLVQGHSIWGRLQATCGCISEYGAHTYDHKTEMISPGNWTLYAWMYSRQAIRMIRIGLRHLLDYQLWFGS